MTVTESDIKEFEKRMSAYHGDNDFYDAVSLSISELKKMAGIKEEFQ